MKISFFIPSATRIPTNGQDLSGEGDFQCRDVACHISEYL